MTEASTNKGNPIGRWFADRLETHIDWLWLGVVMLYVLPVYAQDVIPDIVTDERTGVKIVFYDFSKHENDMISRWQDESVTVEVVPAKPENRHHYESYAKYAMEQYPAELIKKYLRTLYIAEEIKVTAGDRFINLGGTYDRAHGAIYLTTGGGG